MVPSKFASLTCLHYPTEALDKVALPLLLRLPLLAAEAVAEQQVYFHVEPLLHGY